MLPCDLGKCVYLTSQHPQVPEMSGIMVISGYILGLFLLFLGGIVVVFGEAIWNSGITIIYVILYKLQENESLLEREDEELMEDEEEEEAVPSEESDEKDEPEPEEKPKKSGRENKSKESPPEED